MNLVATYRRRLAVLLAAGLLAALFVAAYRVHVESQTRRVEIAMDYTDFSALAQSYGYNEEQFLIALRRAGLTSLAVNEELGGAIDSSRGAVVVAGQALIDAGRVSQISDPTLAALLRSGAIRDDEIYMIVDSPADVARYRENVGLHLGPAAIRTIREKSPTILAVRSQIDFFNALGFGLPPGPLALTKKLGLLLVPRVQNDQRFGAEQIDKMFDAFNRGQRASTVIFSGNANEVLGYPDHLDDTAAAFERTHQNFGSVEVYDKNQIQKGTEGLAQRIPAQTTRVQAIAKAELAKLDFQTMIARYLLGVRERNVRVVYLRPWPRPEGDLSIEKTNVEMVRQIAEGLEARGFKLGRATPVRDFHIPPFVPAIVSLAVIGIVLLLFDVFGVPLRRYALAIFAVVFVAMLAAGFVHHDILLRKIVALAGAIAFAVAAVVAVSRAFVVRRLGSAAAGIASGLRTLAIAVVVALGGALVVVGLLSTPLLMEEIDRFSGVKAVIVLPPLIVLFLYFFTEKFGREPMSPREGLAAPVRMVHVAALAVLGGLAVLYIARSGNQSDIAPSTFELSLRSGLTAALGVRPRLKEFLIGFPLLMLLPNLRIAHRRAFGWLIAVGIAIGTADIVDTFSHLHTPLVVSLLRLVNGIVVGAIVGTIAVLAYRRLTAEASDRAA